MQQGPSTGRGLEHDALEDEVLAALPADAVLKAFIGKLPVAIWAKDIHGRYLFANPAAHLLFNVPLDTELRGRSDNDFFSSADAAAFRAKDREIIEKGLSERFYEPITLADGTKHVVTCKFALRLQGVMASCGICFEITEAVRLREGLELANDRLMVREQQLLMLSRSPAIDAGEIDASLQLIATAALKGLAVGRVGIWLWDAPRESLHCALLLAPGPVSGTPPLLRSRYPIYCAAIDDAPHLLTHDVLRDLRTMELAEDYLKPHNIGAMLDEPIRLTGETRGVLCCEHVGETRQWTEAEAVYAATLAEIVGRALVAQQRRQAELGLRELNQALEARVVAETRDARRAEAEAEAARQQLQDITDQMPGAVCQLLWHGPGRLQFVYLSDGITRVTGMSASTFTTGGQSMLSAIHPEDLPGLIAGIDAAGQCPGQMLEQIFRTTHSRTGETLWVELQSRGRVWPAGGVLFNGTFTDITTRKRLEGAVGESERLLKAAMSASLDGIWEWNLITDAVFFSESWMRQLGYDAHELPQRLETFTQLCHPDDIAATFAAVASTVEHAQNIGYSAEFRLRRKDGRWQWILGRGNISQRDASGRALRLTGTNVDIDERKRLEDSLAIASRLAQDASKAKGEFLANMSHEIRTPMNAVIGLANLLGDTPLDDHQRDYLNKLQMASRTLLALINDVLDLSKIESGKLSIESRPFDLDIELDNLCTLVTPQASAKGLALIRELPPELPSVLMGDSMRIGQVLLNLVGNAVKFTDQGSVTLSVGWQPANLTEGMLRFAVRDTGIGISPDRIGKLFNPFEQEDASTSRRYGGTGLGLSISRQLVALMNGQMGVDSVPGEGSTFWFTVRAGVSSSGAIEKPLMKVTDTSPLQGLQVLVAEDNDINLEILTELLSRVGVVVRSARDGAEVIAACTHAPPHLVLMDMQMPDIDGLTATTLLRADARFAKLPIIALTANAMSEDRARCLAAGMDDHLPKPIDVDQLYAMLLRWMPKGSAPR